MSDEVPIDVRIALAGPERARIATIIGCKHCHLHGHTIVNGGVSECGYCGGTAINPEAYWGQVVEDDTVDDPAVLVRWLIEQGAAEAMVAGLIEAGVLVSVGVWEGVPDADGMVIGGDQGWFYDGEDRPADARPLYRIGGTDDY